MAKKVNKKKNSKRSSKLSSVSGNGDTDNYLVPSDIGEGIFFTETISPGLTIIYADYRWKAGFVSANPVEYGDDVVFRFRVSGESTLTYSNVDRVFEFKEGDCCVITTNSALTGIAREESTGDRKMYVTIRFSRKYLKNLLKNVDVDLTSFMSTPPGRRKKNAEEIYYESRAISPATHIVIQQILQCQLSEELKRIFLEAKCQELIALFLNSSPIPRFQSATKVKFSEADIERIKAARDILVTNLISPPSIEELAEAVGMKVTKLKLGFKHVFSTTAFHYLRDRRLEQARTLLSEGNKTIEEIAQECGFPNASHFTQAFNKHFGILPKVIKGQKL